MNIQVSPLAIGVPEEEKAATYVPTTKFQITPLHSTPKLFASKTNVAVKQGINKINRIVDRETKSNVDNSIDRKFSCLKFLFVSKIVEF